MKPWEEAYLRQVADARATREYPSVLGGEAKGSECPRCVALAECNAELLEALRRIETWLTNQPLDVFSKHEMLREVSAAITKAEGV